VPLLRFVALGGFLGAGKTTTALAAAERLTARGQRVAVVTNDQGSELVDTGLASERVAAVGEVTGGCFCCRFDDLADVTLELLGGGVDTILAEAVGSCADLQATVIRPLRANLGDRLEVAPLTVVVDPLRYADFELARAGGEVEADLEYLFRKQLEEADLIALNKVDLSTPEERSALRAVLERRFPDGTVVEVSASTGEGMDELLERWGGPEPAAADLEIDYERYGRAEARLAWGNFVFALEPLHGAGLAFEEWLLVFLQRVAAACREGGHRVGHVKARLESEQGAATGNLVSEAGPPVLAPGAAIHGRGVTATVNGRVACAPEDLSSIVATAAAEASRATGANCRLTSESVFRPAQPVPVHRVPA
jgi:Ni2+-binding GTPase involved in maturation of urease and hydrogenase